MNYFLYGTATGLILMGVAGLGTAVIMYGLKYERARKRRREAERDGTK